MSDRLTLDVPSFETLLRAAWVLQCLQDPEVTHRSNAAVAVGRQAASVVVPEAIKVTSLPDEPQVLSRRQVRVRFPAHSERTLHMAVASAEPLLILLIMVAFLLSELWSRGSTSIFFKAIPSISQITGSDLIEHNKTGQPEAQAASQSAEADAFLPSLESSHLQVTDATTWSVVDALSPYEMKTLRRQAEYGDESAGLTLGMAYETGRHVPQSCTKAAHWVTLAAAEGSAAAQYNLALRYLQGDGIPTDLEAGNRWLQKAADRGYLKAKSALRARTHRLNE